MFPSPSPDRPVNSGARATTRQLSGILSALLLMLLLLTGCDGGIFGTGDGGDIVSPTDVEGSDPTDNGTEPDEGDSIAPEEPVTEPESPLAPGADSGDATIELRAFENLDTGSDSATPLLSLINLSQQSLGAFSDTDTQALFSAPVQPGALSPRVTVPLGTESLSVIDTDTDNTQLVLSPLNLGNASVTTLIARDRLAEPGAGPGAGPGADPETDIDPETSSATVDILALPARLSLSDDALARVRLLQVYPIAGDDRAGQMMLLPAGANPGGSEVSLGLVSAADFLQTLVYQTVTAGSYELQDSLSRFAPYPLTLSPGHAYTLILTGSETVLLIVQDSETGG